MSKHKIININKEFVPYSEVKELENNLCKCYYEGYYKQNYIFPGTRYTCCYCYDTHKFENNITKPYSMLPILGTCAIFIDLLTLPCRIINNYRVLNSRVNSESNISINVTIDNEIESELETSDIISEPPSYTEININTNNTV
jgi:hypothetical protein